jgi:hypothetical protein
MRVRATATLLLLLAAACRQGGGTGATPDPSPPAIPRELPGASCDEQRGGTEEILPDFVKVELESEGGVDRIRFLFRPTAPDQPDVPPAYIVSYVDRLLTDGEGAPVDVEGEAFVSVSFQAIGVDLTQEMPVEVYTGPKEFTPRFPTVREVEQTGDFEAVVSWGIGLAREACVAVTAEGGSLTLEFPSA